jgi:hypothetical protein
VLVLVLVLVLLFFALRNLSLLSKRSMHSMLLQ